MESFLNARKAAQTISEQPVFAADGLSCNNFYFIKDGVPVFPAVGEAHPMRLDPRFWEDVIVKMKCGGLNAVSFYVFWLFVQPTPDTFCFTGRCNIRRFVQLCAKHGMYALPRIGPFCNAELAHGGLPSWLYGMPVSERSNDEGYFALVNRYYNAIGEQFKGLYYKDGGPIVSVQIENEYGCAPALWSGFYPYGGSELVSKGDGGDAHMRRLKALALGAGIDVPFYTATSWGGSSCPEDEYLPVYGGYAYLSASGPTETSTFSFSHDSRRTPYATTELGTGCDTQKGWRPHIPPQAAETTFCAALAQGCSAAGFYMYAGGTNPPSYERFYVSDMKYLCMPLMSYDFSAPIGEYGLTTEAYTRLRQWLLFARDFAPELLKTKPVWAEEYVRPEDTEHLRCMARADGDSGFVFINNYQDKLKLPARENVAVRLALPGGELRIPRRGGFAVAEDEDLMFPFRLDLNGVTLEYATAIPFCRLNGGYVFRRAERAEAVYAFADSYNIVGGAARCEDGFAYVSPRGDEPFSAGGVKLLTLGNEQARHTLKIQLNGQDALLYSPQDFTYEDGGAVFTSFEPEFSYSLLGFDGVKTKKLTVPERTVRANIEILNETWANVRVDRAEFEGLEDVFLFLDFDGDIARVFSDGKLVADRYNDGTTWKISLRHLYKEVTSARSLSIRLLPKTYGGTSMYFDGITFKPVSENGGKTGFIKLSVVPRYRVRLRIGL